MTWMRPASSLRRYGIAFDLIAGGGAVCKLTRYGIFRSVPIAGPSRTFAHGTVWRVAP